MNFNVEKVTDEIIKFIRNYYKENKVTGVVIGISGGKDSAVVAGLFVKALGSSNVAGLWMPCHSKEEDKEDAMLVAKTFNFEMKEHDLTNVYDMFLNDVDILDNDANINLKPRLRMATLYYYARMFTSIKKRTYIVAGTYNKSELFIGYFTKGGDNICDIGILSDLTTDEVIEIGKYIGVPDKILYKTPNDGLSNLSDEEKLGVKYSDINRVINNLDVDENIKNYILNLHQKNIHKFNIPNFKK